jgi:hypothetical protein
LALPIGSAPCSPTSRTNRWLFGLWVRRIRDHDHTGATASRALFVVRFLVRLFGVHESLPVCNSVGDTAAAPPVTLTDLKSGPEGACEVTLFTKGPRTRRGQSHPLGNRAPREVIIRGSRSEACSHVCVAPRRQFLHLAAGAVALPAASQVARAQTYPSRPVRIIVGFPAGGTQDMIVRLIGQWLSEQMGQPFLIESRPGANGNIGA